MIDDVPVIDAVAHGYNFASENRVGEPYASSFANILYDGFHINFHPNAEPKWIMDRDRWMNRGADPELVARCFFAESRTDAIIYHGVPYFGAFRDGGSPLWVGKAIKEQAPHRVLLYGPVSPWQANPLEEVDRLIDEEGVVGIKFYPIDLVDGEIRDVPMDSEERVFPVIERARAKGVRHIAVHKSVPLGPTRLEPFLLGNLDGALMAFPDVTFEIVHGGFAFLEETAFQVARFPNVYVNLEATSAFLGNAPRKLAEIIGTLMMYGGRDRILWATGASSMHPQPFLQRFWDMEMPRDMVEGLGFPDLTREDKAAILSNNIARMHGLDLDRLKGDWSGDAYGAWTRGERSLDEPWSAPDGGRSAA